jgi:pimeloyl-ACP methyl ester carboxylesterase
MTTTLSEMTIDGATVAWTDTGTGHPILLLHAGVFGAWFEPLAGLLPGRVVRVLRAGYTDGPPPDRPVEIADHAAHAAAVLDALRTGPATVVAHSSACAIALQLAHDRPDLVRDLVLSEPPLVDPLIDPADAAEVAGLLGPAMGAAMGASARGDAPAAFDAFMSAVCGPRHRAVLLDVLGADGLARAERDSAFFFADEVPALGRWTPVGPVDAPVLLVRGGASAGPTHRLVDRMAAALPGARVATVDGADHLLPLTHPRALARLVADRA